MNSKEMTRQITDILKSTQHSWRDISTSQRPLSIRISCSQTRYVGGTDVTESVRSGGHIIRMENTRAVQMIFLLGKLYVWKTESRKTKAVMYG